jgi:hypothetical protein
MAYDFTSANSQYFTTGTSPVTVEPFTLSCWFNRKTSGVGQRLLSIDRRVASGTGFHSLNLGATLLTLVANSSDGSAVFAQTSATYSLNTWNHACGTYSANNSRTVYLNGGNAVTNTSLKVVTGLANVTIGGGFQNGLFVNPSNALIAEVGIWNAALTAAEIASLAKGMTCDKVRPQSLVFYAPLVRDLNDQKGGLTITNNNGTTIATHPRVYA